MDSILTWGLVKSVAEYKLYPSKLKMMLHELTLHLTNKTMCLKQQDRGEESRLKLSPKKLSKLTSIWCLVLIKAYIDRMSILKATLKDWLSITIVHTISRVLVKLSTKTSSRGNTTTRWIRTCQTKLIEFRTLLINEIIEQGSGAGVPWIQCPAELRLG